MYMRGLFPSQRAGLGGPPRIAAPAARVEAGSQEVGAALKTEDP